MSSQFTFVNLTSDKDSDLDNSTLSELPEPNLGLGLRGKKRDFTLLLLLDFFNDSLEEAGEGLIRGRFSTDNAGLLIEVMLSW